MADYTRDEISFDSGPGGTINNANVKLCGNTAEYMNIDVDQSTM